MAKRGEIEMTREEIYKALNDIFLKDSSLSELERESESMALTNILYSFQVKKSNDNKEGN
jgi:hypothetical protein